MPENSRSPHILNAASNLVGFSFVVFTALHSLESAAISYLDELAAFEILLFSVSCLLSFLSIRTKSDVYSNRYESIADYFFFIGLIALCLIAVSAPFTNFSR